MTFTLSVVLVSRKYSFSAVPQGSERATKKEGTVTVSHTRAHPCSSGKCLACRKSLGAALSPGEELPRPCLCPGLGGSSWQLGSVAILAVSAVSRSLRTEIQPCDYSHYIYYPTSIQLNTGIEKN